MTAARRWRHSFTSWTATDGDNLGSVTQCNDGMFNSTGTVKVTNSALNGNSTTGTAGGISTLTAQ
jgi:hypothetical protein